ncbi:MAG: hypothetical protein D6698_01760 [Gammaproteobacteria bacterium]|nr:MAG: hypothetical protein D6698_01760 [Gammaproteobacteria bacterium]
MANKPTTVKLPFQRETKNMLKYEVSPEEKKAKTAPIPTLYVSQSLFTQGEWPAFLEITVKGVDK